MRNIQFNQIIVFIISLIVFLTAAIFGWEKLHYGLNYADEGYHMTEAWRLTAGDDYFQAKFTGAINLSPFITRFFFKIDPNIKLLELRKLQFFSAIFSLLIFSVALYKLNKQYWYQPLVFSLFAFTGLDPNGFIYNFSYDTYQHLFLVLHISFLILGLYQKSLILRRFLLATSGFCLWLISFNLLHLSPVILSPVILYYMLSKWKNDHMTFNFKDFCALTAPILLSWIIFIGIFNVAYFQNIFASIQLMGSTTAYSPKGLFNFNWEYLERISIVIIYLIICFYLLSKFRTSFFIISFSVLSIIMYLIIDGLIKNNWANKSLWLCSLLFSFYIFFLCYFTFKIFTNRYFDKSDLAAIVILIPSIILTVCSITISSLGFFNVSYSSIPVIGAVSVLILSHKNIERTSYLKKWLILVILFAPFYYSTAWSNWRSNLFDVAPESANVVIDAGFCEGIRTNRIYKNLYDWVSVKADEYSNKDDYIISYSLSPMVHMITKRRPALDDTYIKYLNGFSLSYYEKSIYMMKKKGRDPQMAFIFEIPPILLPTSLEFNNQYYVWWDQQFIFPGEDPISKYVVENMRFEDQYQVQGTDIIVRCFIKNQ